MEHQIIIDDGQDIIEVTESSSNINVNEKKININVESNKNEFTVEEHKEPFIVQDGGEVVEFEFRETIVINRTIGSGTGSTSTTELIVYDELFDWINSVEVIKGIALPGTLTSSLNWNIFKVNISFNDEPIITYANGEDEFNKSWDNRNTYSFESL